MAKKKAATKRKYSTKTSHHSHYEFVVITAGAIILLIAMTGLLPF